MTCSSVAIPEIVPFVLLKFRPLGRAGQISHVSAIPSLYRTGIIGISELAVLLTSVTLYGMYSKSITGSTIVMLIMCEIEPPVLFAYTV